MTIARKSHLAIASITITNIGMWISYRHQVPLCRPASAFKGEWKQAKKRPSCARCKQCIRNWVTMMSEDGVRLYAPSMQWVITHLQRAPIRSMFYINTPDNNEIIGRYYD